jgi:septal ring factor EnvC (AmiA/AmiB activator)
MNMPVLKENSPWAGPIAGAVTGGVISGIFGLVILSYGAQINSAASSQANIAAAQAETIREQAVELREHDQKISALETSDKARQAQDDRTAKAIGDMQNDQSAMAGQIINVRNSTDEANRRLDALQKSFDTLLDFIKPSRPLGR